MRLRPYKQAFLVMGWALICSISVSAQEGKGQMDTEPVVKEAPHSDPDPTLNTESDTRNINKVTPPAVLPKETLRDSIQVKITKPTKTTEKGQEEDPLSFNFLYYIIGKFKLSDIIE